MNIIGPFARIPEDEFYGNNINDNKINQDVKENNENKNSEVNVYDEVSLSPEAKEHLEAHGPRTVYRPPNG